MRFLAALPFVILITFLIGYVLWFNQSEMQPLSTRGPLRSHFRSAR